MFLPDYLPNIQVFVALGVSCIITVGLNAALHQTDEEEGMGQHRFVLTALSSTWSSRVLLLWAASLCW